MIRRSTWIVFAVFLVLALAAIFLLNSPGSPLATDVEQTPSVTPAPQVIEGWEFTDVTGIEWIESDGPGQQLTRDAEGNWIDTAKQTVVQTGKVEELLSELLAMRVLTSMPGDYALDALALTSPQQKIVLARQDGSTLDFSIGALAPTGNGYYVRTDDNPPVVVSKYALDAVTQLFTDLQATATPTIAVTLEATATP